MSFTHCKGCGKLINSWNERDDGLCSSGSDVSEYLCFFRWSKWVARTNPETSALFQAVNPFVAYASPLRAVSIDQWLEAGAP